MVDDFCKIVRWDQYGDNEEQTDTNKAVIDVVIDLVIVLLCILGGTPPEQ